MEDLEYAIHESIWESIIDCLKGTSHLTEDKWLYSPNFFTQTYDVVEQIWMTHDISSSFNSYGIEGLKQLKKIMIRDLKNVKSLIAFDQYVDIQVANQEIMKRQETIKPF